MHFYKLASFLHRHWKGVLFSLVTVGFGLQILVYTFLLPPSQESRYKYDPELVPNGVILPPPLDEPVGKLIHQDGFWPFSKTIYHFSSIIHVDGKGVRTETYLCDIEYFSVYRYFEGLIKCNKKHEHFKAAHGMKKSSNYNLEKLKITKFKQLYRTLEKEFLDPDDIILKATNERINEAYKSVIVESYPPETKAMLKKMINDNKQSSWSFYQQLPNMNIFHIKSRLNLKLQIPNIKNISALEGISIYNLNLSGTSVADISALKGMPIYSLNLSGCRTLVDISSLNGMSITKLNLSETSVVNISALKGMPLERLNLGETKVKNIDALEGMNLRSLILPFKPIDIEFLREMNLLEEINDVAAELFWFKYDTKQDYSSRIDKECGNGILAQSAFRHFLDSKPYGYLIIKNAKEKLAKKENDEALMNLPTGDSDMAPETW
ncbi:MAG: hypothetical protein HRT89_04355 [Lentisphaeria bacterium]|nr:hypothetical protein [Lentisphaeria bacterium]NQZ67283.1 hypothetical protein [Lentisphaeria bacterium]